MQDEKIIERLLSDHTAMSQAMAGVRESVAELKGAIGTMNTNITSLTQAIGELKTEDKTLHERVGDRSNEIADLTERLTRLETKLDNNWKWFLALAAWATAVAGAFAFFT